jgi:hypothetical protein
MRIERMNRVEKHIGVVRPAVKWLHLVLSIMALFMTLVISPWYIQNANAGESLIHDYIDVNALKAIDSSWQVVVEEIRHDGGKVKLRNSKWLMYFLHWRPLEKSNMDLTFDYARRHMLNFWGESMPFELSGIESETVVCGHRAVIIEGSIYDGRIITRFIVWNCPETGRQFTADCNINLGRGTPRRLLDVQRDITETVRCHPPIAATGNKDLPGSYESAKWGVSFSLPKNWRTDDFLSKEWFPEGMSFDRGSLWTLLEDSDKRIDLRWDTTDDGVSEELFHRFLKQLPRDPAVQNDSALSMTVQLDTLRHESDCCFGRGTYRYSKNVEGRNYSSEYRFCSLLWKEDGRTFFLTASIVSISEFWGIPVELVPSDERMDRYLREEILPNVTVFDGRY